MFLINRDMESMGSIQASSETFSTYIFQHSTMDSVLASHPAAPGSVLGVPEDFPMDIFFRCRRDLSTALLSIKLTV